MKRAADTAAQQPVSRGAGSPRSHDPRPTHTASTRTAPLSVARLAEATRQLNDCRALVEDLRTLTEAMAQTRLTSVVGEQELITTLVALITRADDQIARMASGAAGHRRSCMTTLEGLLAEPEWTVARSSRQQLRARKAALDTVTASITEEYRSLQLNFERLHHVVERASELRYDDAESEAELALDVVGKFRTSDLDFRSGRYDTAAVAVQHAKRRLAEKGLTLPRGHPDEVDPDQVDVDAAKFETYTAELERKVRDAELRDSKLARRTELFLISGATVDLSVPYKVLLRRPNFGTIQESNLYDDVEVLLTDQDLFRETIDTIAESSIQGIRSAAAATNAPVQASPVAQEGPAAPEAPAAPAAPAGLAAPVGAPAVRRAAPVRAISTDHLDQLDTAGRLERIGRRMYSLLIPDAMQRIIDETDEFPLTITSNNPELPWELLHDGTEFLCLKRTFARMPAQQTFPRRTRDAALTVERRKTTVLLVHSVHGEPLQQAEKEINDIEARLAEMSPAPIVTKLTGSDVTASRLTDELSLGDYDLIHYAGHAGFDAGRPELSYLLLSTGEHFRAERVQRLLEGHPVVFLNACESSKSAPQAQGRSTGGTVAQAQGLASAFVYGGAQACVGSLWPVFDDTAADLAVEFYRQLIEKRQRVGEALRRARVMSHDRQQDRTTWAAYALYGDPSSLLAASGGLT
ncbi:CHAT domain-containing protein [Humibacillus xanthopallidus]|uniref:CHAT domain-containing protein n=1 Tax=Humibacillus xanthopallidus TaxID=412689 RepID=A0A543HUG3_9MICO|nr:CHAT domain-containing protein [Humibacillus xanthopallidus]TQM62007.1 CHAT domain-containing protein [Humibacillus xanthopallidus]